MADKYRKKYEIEYSLKELAIYREAYFGLLAAMDKIVDEGKNQDAGHLIKNITSATSQSSVETLAKINNMTKDEENS